MATAIPVLTGDERIARVIVKIDRAKQHLSELNREVRAFLDAKPYVITGYHDENTNEVIYKVARVTPIPDSFPTITGDAIQNLRSSLDHLVCQLWDVSNPGTPAPTRLQFPTDISAAQYMANSASKIKGLRQDAIDLINSIEPYDGGIGKDFSVLNRLNRIDKHRLLIAVGSVFQSVHVATEPSGVYKPRAARQQGITVVPNRIIFPVNQGDEVLRYTFERKVGKYLDFTLGVVLHEPGIVEGKPLVETLQHLSDLVRSTVANFRTCLS